MCPSTQKQINKNKTKKMYMLPTDNINFDKSVHTTPQHKIKTSYKNTTNYKINADEITI